MLDLEKVKPILIHHIIDKIDNPKTNKDNNFQTGHMDEELWSTLINVTIDRNTGRDFIDGTSFKYCGSDNLIVLHSIDKNNIYDSNRIDCVYYNMDKNIGAVFTIEKDLFPKIIDFLDNSSGFAQCTIPVKIIFEKNLYTTITYFRLQYLIPNNYDDFLEKKFAYYYSKVPLLGRRINISEQIGILIYLDIEVINNFQLKVWEIDYSEFKDIKGGGKGYCHCNTCGKLRTNGKIGNLTDCQCKDYLELIKQKIPNIIKTKDIEDIKKVIEILNGSII